jgi:hypothetical protein
VGGLLSALLETTIGERYFVDTEKKNTSKMKKKQVIGFSSLPRHVVATTLQDS